MNHQQNTESDTEEQLIIEEARHALAAYRSLMADTGLTPSSCLDALRRVEGAASVRNVQCEVNEVLRRFEEQTALYVLQASRGPRPVSRRVARRRII